MMCVLRDELVQQTVKLETAKARLKYAKQEAELIQREAALKAETNVLDMKREVEEAESGLQAVKKACEGQSFSLNK
jgi:multidrug efflux pump subunit AcrA (membrane-fusion protein)